MLPKLGKILIIDGSYMIHRSLHVEELWNLTSRSTGERTGGILGFLRSLNYEFRKYDYYPVVTWDSGLSPRRIEVYPEYKKNHIRVADRMLHSTDDIATLTIELEEKFSGRALEEISDSIRDTLAGRRLSDANKYDPDDYRVQYRRQRDILIDILDQLGVPSIKYNNWEGDDLMVLLSRMSDDNIVMTDDRDLIQLISPNTRIARPMSKQFLDYESYLRSEGFDDVREMVIIKAIVGDGADNIPSVTAGLERKYRLGDTRARYVAKLILESSSNPDIYLPKLVELNKNYYKGFIENHDIFLRNMKLVDLSLVPNDQEIMNSAAETIREKVGKCNLVNSLQHLASQEISSFDTNGFISKMITLASSV